MADPEDAVFERQNAKRIESFLNEPFGRITNASEQAHARLRARGVVDDALGEGQDDSARRVKLGGSELRTLGPMSRFSDGDGTYWDRWLNTNGCFDGKGKYLESKVPVRGGTLRTKTGFKGLLVGRKKSPREDRQKILARLLENSAAKERMLQQQLIGIFTKTYHANAIRPKASSQFLLKTRQPGTATTDVTNEAIDEMLATLDATTVVNAGCRCLELANQGFDNSQASALGQCLAATACSIPIYSVDISGNSDIGTRGAARIIQAVSTCGTLVLLNLSHIPLDVSSTLVLANCLTGRRQTNEPSFTALRHLILTNTSLDDVLAVRIVRALRTSSSAPALETLDVDSNAIGSVDHIRAQHDDDEKHKQYHAPTIGGPLGALLNATPELDDSEDRDQHAIMSAGELATQNTPSSRGASSLRILKASWNLLGPDIVRGLAKSVASHSRLSQLHLANNAFGDSGVVELSTALAEATSLTFIDLSSNKVGPRGAICLAAAAQRAVMLKRLNVSNNPIGPVGAALLLSVALYPYNWSVLANSSKSRATDIQEQDAQLLLASTREDSNEDIHSEKNGEPSHLLSEAQQAVTDSSVCVMLSGCETLTCSDRKRYAINWLFDTPYVTTKLDSAQARAPWRYQFQLDNPLDRAMAYEVMRITAQSSVYTMCSVRHTTQVERTKIKEVALQRPSMMARDGANKFPVSEEAQKVKFLLHFVKKPARRRSLQNLAETVEYARDMEVKFALLQRVAPGVENSKEFKRAESLELKGSAIIDALKKYSSLDASAIHSFLRTVDADATEVDVQRIIALYDWEGTGTVPKELLVHHMVNELPKLLRGQAASKAQAPYWTATFVSKSYKKWYKEIAANSDQVTGALDAQLLANNTSQPLPRSAWMPPRQGDLDLCFQLGHSPPPELRRVSTQHAVDKIISAVQDLGMIDGVLMHAYRAHVRIQLDEALSLAKPLLESCVEDERKIKTLAGIICLLTRARDARALRSQVLGIFSSSTLEAYRRLRRELGSPLYYAMLGPRAGRYRIDLALRNDKCALRILLEEDSTKCREIKGDSISKEQNQSTKFPDISQHGDFSCFRIAGAIGNGSRQGFGGVDAVADPHCKFAEDRENIFAEGSVEEMNAIFDCDDNRAEERDRASDLGTLGEGVTTFDFVPRRDSSTNLPTPTSSQIAERVVQLGWVRTVEEFCADCCWRKTNNQAFLGSKEEALEAFTFLHRARCPRQYEEDDDNIPDAALSQRSDDSEIIPILGPAIGPHQLEAAAACDSIRKARIREAEGLVSYENVGPSSSGTCGPDVAVEDAFDLIAPYTSISIEHAVAILRRCPLKRFGHNAPRSLREELEESERRVSLSIALAYHLKTLDHEAWAAILKDLIPRERGELIHRVGLLSVWSPLNPDGWYVMDMTVREDRCVSKILVHLEVVEPRSVIESLTPIRSASDLGKSLDWCPETTPASQLWRQGLPSCGVFAFRFTTNGLPASLLRNAFSQYFLRGDSSSLDFITNSLHHDASILSPSYLEFH